MVAPEMQFTQNIKSNLDILRQHIKSFYCREDFERKVKEVDSMKGTSGYRSRRSELNSMCIACGIDIKHLLDESNASQTEGAKKFDRDEREDIKRKELARIPNRMNLKKMFLQELYGIYLKFPTSANYMERMVRRLLGDEFCDDSVRLAILKKFVKETDYHTNSIEKMVKSSLTSGAQKCYAQMDRSGQKQQIVEHLTEDIFHVSGVDFPRWVDFFVRKMGEEEELRPREFILSSSTSAKLRETLSSAGCMVGQYRSATDLLKAILDVPRETLMCHEQALEESLSLAEEEFCLYLHGFSTMGADGRVNGRKDTAIYLPGKIAFAKEHSDIYALMGQPDDICGRMDMPFKVWGNFVLNKIRESTGTFDTNAALPQEDWVSKHTTESMRKAASALGMRNPETMSEQEILEGMVDTGKIKLRKNLDALDTAVRSLEQDLCNHIIRSTEVYRKEKMELLRENSDIWNTLAYRANISGRWGFGIKEWTEFLLQNIESELPPDDFRVSDKSRPLLREVLSAVMPNHDDCASDLERMEKMQECLHAGAQLQMHDICDTLMNSMDDDASKYLKQFSYVKRNGRESTRNEVYEQALKDFKRNNGFDTTLLKLADDLATGKFRVNGQTKEYLYIFAIVFGMEVSFPKSDEERESIDWDRDIEKNLFGDYYTDNLLRYIFDENFRNNPTAFESEPSGEGINYKNYVEVIYLYYLCRTDIAAGERIDRAKRMIDGCVADAANKARLKQELPAKPTDMTMVYKYDHFLGHILQLNENDLRKYLVENFYIYDPDPALNNSRIMMASEQNTVKEYAIKIVSDIRKAIPSNRKDATALNCQIGIESLLSDLEETCGDDRGFVENVLGDEHFVSLIKKMDEILDVNRRGLLDLGTVRSKKRFTRTEFVALYYTYFANIAEDLIDNYEVVDLVDLFEEFCSADRESHQGIDDYLEACRYQKINVTNIFDMFVIFALFQVHLG